MKTLSMSQWKKVLMASIAAIVLSCAVVPASFACCQAGTEGCAAWDYCT